MIPDPLPPPLSVQEAITQLQGLIGLSTVLTAINANAIREALRMGIDALSVVSAVPRDEKENKDHGGTSLTEGASVSVSVHADQLPHDERE